MVYYYYKLCLKEEEKKTPQTFYPRICEMMGKEKKILGEGYKQGVASCDTEQPGF